MMLKMSMFDISIKQMISKLLILTILKYTAGLSFLNFIL